MPSLGVGSSSTRHSLLATRYSPLATRLFFSVSSVPPTFVFSVLLLSSFFLGCGGAPASQALATPTMPPDFAITLSSNSVAVTQGNTSSPFTVSVSGQNNFSGSVQITLNGLPSGVISNPASLFTVAAGSSAQLVLGAGSNAATGDFTITAQGVSRSLSHSTAFGLVVQVPSATVRRYANPAFNGQPSPYKFLLHDKQRQLLYLSGPASIDLFDLQAAAFKPFSLMLIVPSSNRQAHVRTTTYAVWPSRPTLPVSSPPTSARKMSTY